MSRDYEPTPGQWYENVEEEETFRVLTVDEDSELVEIEYLDGEIEEVDLETWHEMDLEKTDEPEGWADRDDDDDDDDDDEDFDEDDDDDDDWDDDDDEDDEDEDR
jgi:segregation and condensation protein B